MDNSTTTTEPSAIDAKKEKQSSSSFLSSFSLSSNAPASINKQRVSQFLTNVLFIILGTFLYFGLGGYFVFLCKIAQANILPTDKYCSPYEEAKAEIKEIDVNLFESYTEPELNVFGEIWYSFLAIFGLDDDKPKASQKIHFPLDAKKIRKDFDNKTNNKFSSWKNEDIPDLLNDSNVDPKIKNYISNVFQPLMDNTKSFFPEWFVRLKKTTEDPFIFGIIDTIESVVSLGFSLITTLFDFLNRHVPPLFLYLFSPFLLKFLFIGLVAVGAIWGVIKSFINLSYFFKDKNKSAKNVTVESMKWEWTEVCWGRLFYFFTALWVIYLIFIGLIPSIVLIMIAVFFISFLRFSGMVRGTNNVMNATDVAWSMVRRNKELVAFVILLGITISANAHLGPLFGAVSLITSILILMNKISFIDLFAPTDFTGFTKLASLNQAGRKCSNDGKYDDYDKGSWSFNWFCFSKSSGDFGLFKIGVPDTEDKLAASNIELTNISSSSSPGISQVADTIEAIGFNKEQTVDMNKIVENLQK